MSPVHTWFVYLLECAGGRLYTGITPDLEARFQKHCAGRGARFTRSYPPVRILAAEPCSDRSRASQMEYRIKRLSAAEKRRIAATWALTHDLPGRSS